MNADKPKVIVVGGGLGGLWAALKIAEAGYVVEIFSLFEVKRSHSACAQGGINACLDTKGERDSIRQHFVDTIKGGSYLANQPPVKSLCEEAPGLLRTFERMGVTFSRTAEGILDLRLFGGVKNRRTCFAGASTGQQLLYSVDEQVRRFEAGGRVIKREWWEFLSILKDKEGVCRGIVAMDLKSLEVHAFPAGAVVLATGGLGQIYAPKTTNSTNSTGAAASRVFQQGAKFANAEFFQFHPTAMLGGDKTRLMSEAARGEGGRIWVPRDPSDNRDPVAIPGRDRFYFLEEWYPAYGNTVARDIASRAIWKAVREMGLGIHGEDKVYLDITHLDSDFVERRLCAILQIYRKFHGDDPVTRPMEIFPAAHYAMGGLWIDFEKDESTLGLKYGSVRNHATNIPGLYACGECDYGYHGANRLGANSLLSASFSGRITGESVVTYLAGLPDARPPLPVNAEAEEISRQEAINSSLMKARGRENVYELHQELGELMTARVGVIRDNDSLDKAGEELHELQAKLGRVDLGERRSWANQTLIYARHLKEMIVLGQVMARSARVRDECRGAHHKPDFRIEMPKDKFPGDSEFEKFRRDWQRKNETWLKTSVAEYDERQPRITLEDIDTSTLPPLEPMDYR